MFLPASLLELVDICILRQIPRTKAGSRFDGIITEKYSKLARVIPTAKIELWQAVNAFPKDCTIS